MSNEIIKKFQEAELLINNNAFSEIKGNNDYDYLISELIEYVEENENDQYVITTQTIRDFCRPLPTGFLLLFRRLRCL